MKHLDLFSGIGGFALAARNVGWETVAFCEIDPYCQRVLAKHWPGVPIHDDIRELTGEQIGPVDIVTGGFPCQDISLAGKQAGIGEGTRSGLWSECARLLRGIRPRYAVFENVTALISGKSGKWFQQVLWDISQVGYDAEWHCISASELGANHHRDRVWIIAYPSSDGCDSFRVRSGADKKKCGNKNGLDNSMGSDVANTNSQRQQARKELLLSRGEKFSAWKDDSTRGHWSTEPGMGRVANGVPSRVDRLRGLGNAIVPQVAEVIFRAIQEIDC